MASIDLGENNSQQSELQGVSDIVQDLKEWLLELANIHYVLTLVGV